MALNKSNKSTPSSRSGYFTELTASTGKQSNFLLPIRIKVTPNHAIAPLSDGKKNPSKMLQPVLIKDLFQSTQKDRNNSVLTSVSTQKKKTQSQRLTQPYLNTQSCYKPKQDEVEESTFFNRKSYGGNKVRRQLYQTLDSPQKSTQYGKENTSKVTKPKKKVTEEPTMKNNQNKRTSLLLPPNSIKNNFIRKSESNFKLPSKKSVKSTATVNKSTKNVSRFTEVVKIKTRGKNIEEAADETDMEVNYSSYASSECNNKQSCMIMCDKYTMTSPIYGELSTTKSLPNVNKSERPTVIISPSKIMYASKYSNGVEPPYLEMQNLSINKTPHNSAGQAKVFNKICPYTEFDFTKMNNLDQNGFLQLKFYLEKSIEACENQAQNLKQILNLVNNMFSGTTDKINSLAVKSDEKCDLSGTLVNKEDDLSTTEIINKSLSGNNVSDNLDQIPVKAENNQSGNISKGEAEEKLPIPIKILVTEADLNQEAKEISLEALSDMARLSTIGEVSCEVDDSNKEERDESENKENVSNITIKVTCPVTPKTPRRRSTTDNCESLNRRRSARLAAKRISLSNLEDSDNQDSFTMLENELNVERNTLPSKSLPASPMKPPPLTPGVIRQWDKRIERPLKEYMALKMNGTFLVTPDVKRFQSRLEPSDTPHSRKSLSRKIFDELCDLYADSPEPK